MVAEDHGHLMSSMCCLVFDKHIRRLLMNEVLRCDSRAKTFFHQGEGSPGCPCLYTS